jgi:eukaryotic-like serine/threonine-protein kinase
LPVFICQSCGAEHSDWGGNCPNCGGSETIRLQAQTDKLIGRTIKNKYKIVKRLGQGGMGAVYLAEQLGIGLKVALKFLKSELSSDAEICRRFLNEAKSYALVAHPNAVTLHEFGQDEEGNLFIAMEYVEGTDLKKELAEKKRLPTHEAISIALQATDILGHAHSRGVVHRDLKPENLMLRRGSRGIHIKIMDFGIARLMNEGTKLTLAGSIAGTPRYMSPEQVEGREVDHRADIYSLGIVLYESLTGVQPFDGSSIGEILRKQVTQQLPALAEHGAGLDLPPIDHVLQQACAKERDERFQSMAAFAEALEQYQPTGVIRAPGERATDQVRASDVAAASAMGAATGSVSIAGDATGLQKGSDLGTVSGGVSLLNKSLDGRTQAGDLSIAPAAKKSPVPMIVGGVVLAAIAGGAFFAFAPQRTAAVTPPPVVDRPKDPQPQPQPTEQPKPPPDVQTVPMPVAIGALERTNSNNAYGNGTTEFANGNIETAKNYFKNVLEGTDHHLEAQAQLKIIEAIETNYRKAEGLRSRGECAAAGPFYGAAIKLNPQYKPAQQGAAFCRSAQAPTRLE